MEKINKLGFGFLRLPISVGANEPDWEKVKYYRLLDELF